MQSIKRLVHAKNNRVWSVKQTTSGSPSWDPEVVCFTDILFNLFSSNCLYRFTRYHRRALRLFRFLYIFFYFFK